MRLLGIEGARPTARSDARRAEAQWRASPHAWQRPQPTVAGIVLSQVGGWVAEHALALSALLLCTCFAAGVATGRCL